MLNVQFFWWNAKPDQTRKKTSKMGIRNVQFGMPFGNQTCIIFVAHFGIFNSKFVLWTLALCCESFGVMAFMNLNIENTLNILAFWSRNFGLLTLWNRPLSAPQQNKIKILFVLFHICLLCVRSKCEKAGKLFPVQSKTYSLGFKA